ncbi:MAG: MAC/perforin domain-containing protein [Pseudomonadota bacterium]
MNPNSLPSDYILQSFNAFQDEIAQSPEKVLDYTNDVLRAPLTADQLQSLSENSFRGEGSSFSSAEETSRDFAAKVGISGSYGFFSASAQASYETKQIQTATSYNYGYNATLTMGATSFAQASNVQAIRQCLSTEMVSALDAISSVAAASDFTATYGTHLILRVTQGGSLYISIVATADSESSEQTMSAEIKAAYSAAVSVSATASAMSKIASKYQSSSLTQTVTASGGDPQMASQIDPNTPATFTGWTSSCTKDTVCAVAETIEIMALASGQAKVFLQTYIGMITLRQSINNPSYFSKSAPVYPSVENKVEATVPAGYKIIAGGAAVTGPNNFLTQSCPSIDSHAVIEGWTAGCYDIDVNANPATDILTAYAVAVYDPANLLSVQVVQGSGSNPGSGPDKAAAQVTDILTGGGVSSRWQSNGPRYILGCFPSSDTEWSAATRDYETPSSGVVLTVYAIGVSLAPLASANLTITSTIINQSAYRQEYGATTASLSQVNVASGGCNIEDATGWGNLLQCSKPSTPTDWVVYQKDTGGHSSQANVTAYALGIDAQFSDTRVQG